MEACLIKRVVADGDPLSFTLLVKMHQSTVRSFLRKLTSGDIDLADDLSQNTFLKAFRNIKSYSAKGKFISWLLQIAYREFVDDLRRNSKHSNHLEFFDEHYSKEAQTEPTMQTTSLSLHRALANLAPLEQAILSLNYSQGMTHEEIASLIDLPVGTVKTKIARAKVKLKTLLSDDTKPIQELMT